MLCKMSYSALFEFDANQRAVPIENFDILHCKKFGETFLRFMGLILSLSKENLMLLLKMGDPFEGNICSADCYALVQSYRETTQFTPEYALRHSKSLAAC